MPKLVVAFEHSVVFWLETTAYLIAADLQVFPFRSLDRLKSISPPEMLNGLLLESVMNLSARKSSIHHHLTRPAAKKMGSRSTTDTTTPKVESGFGRLQIGTETLPVRDAYKPIFRF